jgi:FKBP-type peptidyl-prolyl cis-trans isomerase
MMLASCDKKTSAGSQPAGISKSDIDSVSYMIGYSTGMQMMQSNFGPLNANAIIKGIQDAGKGVEVDYAVFQNVVNGFMDKRNEAISAENAEKSAKMLAANGKKADVVTTESGLQYMIVREGTGVKPTERDTVEVNYEGKNLAGKVFDSSYERGTTVTFPLNGVIRGWTEGMQYVGEGGEIMLWIPADLAYGERNVGSDIGPNEALTFKVELVSVKPYVEKPVSE